MFVDVRGEQSNTTGPSPIIWADCPVLPMLENPTIGHHFFDDFINCPRTSAGVGTPQGPYACYGDTGVTILPQAAVENGVAEVAGNDADNDESVLSGMSPSFNICDTAGEEHKLWFEARVKKASIANNACAMFVGLGWDYGDGVNVAKTLCLTDDDANLGAFSFIGFHVDQADGDAMDFVYKAEGQAQTVLIAGVHVPVADTWVKVGFVYDPDFPAAKRIKVYVNGTEQTTYATATNIATATFPDDEGMAPVWCVKVGAAAESKAQMDWWRVAQLRF